jgi:hypothetical protein
VRIRDRASELAQKIHDLRLAPVHRADKLASDYSVAIDDIGLWNLESPIQPATFLVDVADGGEVNLVGGQEFVIRLAIGVPADPENHNALVLQPLLQLLERGRLFDAGRAVASPEVQHHDLAAKVGEANFAIGILNREVGSGGADVGGPGAAVTSRQQQGYDADQNRSLPHKVIIPNSAYAGVRYSIEPADRVGDHPGA